MPLISLCSRFRIYLQTAFCIINSLIVRCIACLAILTYHVSYLTSTFNIAYLLVPTFPIFSAALFSFIASISLKYRTSDIYIY
ncbi:hypothetical protein C8J57DRAFT_1374464 [Mycena rebaudengoi]|nr:hypothetical protein C8J57DRAFT_1411918 [Mycena rebaudengoi]KAJ7237985.1 hypothetical protein C8J57DRAFT_1374464 [Mycena rebaudengoi]